MNETAEISAFTNLFFQAGGISFCFIFKYIEGSIDIRYAFWKWFRGLKKSLGTTIKVFSLNSNSKLYWLGLRNKYEIHKLK